MTATMMVTKASGELQAFSEEKLLSSLVKSGADPVLADEIVEHISGQVFEGMGTNAIHDRAFAMLKARQGISAARYNLKRAVAELGPSGFPFERYVARLFDAMGYETSVGVILQGKCISHEIDVVLTKGDVRGLVECKFHATPGAKCDVKVPLYVHARFEDIAEREGGSVANREGWIVTNSRFSEDASVYGACVGLKLLGWNSGPLGESLLRLIDARGLHPVTCLLSVSSERKRELLQDGIVLCKDFLRVARPEEAEAVDEAKALCKH